MCSARKDSRLRLSEHNGLGGRGAVATRGLRCELVTVVQGFGSMPLAQSFERLWQNASLSLPVTSVGVSHGASLFAALTELVGRPPHVDMMLRATLSPHRSHWLQHEGSLSAAADIASLLRLPPLSWPKAPRCGALRNLGRGCGTCRRSVRSAVHVACHCGYVAHVQCYHLHLHMFSRCPGCPCALSKQQSMELLVKPGLRSFASGRA
jgi:hypothetical protein